MNPPFWIIKLANNICREYDYKYKSEENKQIEAYHILLEKKEQIIKELKEKHKDEKKTMV